ncbi:MAG: alpha/beta fold hydrolase [Arenicella sp.]|nr:alpha/beta fold hydrolase [Arenicella sp.]
MKAFEIGAKETVVFYLHGLRGHGYSQKAALEHMVKSLGVRLVSLELPGHGEDSFVEHCMVPEYRQLVAMICDEVTRRAGDSEQVVLMGYSFGGVLMALATAKLDQDVEFLPQVAGYIGLSAAFDVGHNVPRWQLFLAGAIAPLSRFLFRHAPRWSSYVTIREMNVALISSDSVVQQSIHDDELIYKGRIPLNTSAQVYRSSVAAKKILNTIDVPVLLIHSKDDEIALAPTLETFKPHIIVKLFNGLRHNCIDGLSREVVRSRRAITQFIVDML